MKPFRSRLLPGYLALLFSALGLVLTLAMPPGVFSGDEGIKLAQSQALVRSGWTSLALPYLGSDADPEGRYFPFSPPFVWSKDGAWYGIYSFEYTAVAALFWKVGGLRGVFLLSWLGAATALWILATIATRFLKPAGAATVVVATAAGTPLLLYGTTNYEHSWGCALILASLALMAETRPSVRRLMTSGALLGLAASIRPELFAFPVGVAGFAFVYWGPRWKSLAKLATIGSATAAVVVLHLGLNRLFFGSFHPNLEASSHPATSWELNLAKLVSPDAPDTTTWVLLAALMLGCLPVSLPKTRALRAIAALSAIGFLVAADWQAAQAVSPGMFSEPRTLIGLFTATPLVVLGLLRGPLPRRPTGDFGSAVVAAATLFVGTVVLIKLPGFWGGLEMGSRYLLPAAPLLLLAGADGIERYGRGALAVATKVGTLALLLLSVHATVVNARCMHAIREYSARLVADVEQTGIDDVVAGKSWAPMVLAPLYLEKRIYRRTDALLYPNLYDLGRRRFVAVLSNQRPGKVRKVVVSRERVVRPHEVVVFGLSKPVGGGAAFHHLPGNENRGFAPPRLDSERIPRQGEPIARQWQ